MGQKHKHKSRSYSSSSSASSSFESDADVATPVVVSSEKLKVEDRPVPEKKRRRDSTSSSATDHESHSSETPKKSKSKNRTESDTKSSDAKKHKKPKVVVDSPKITLPPAALTPSAEAEAPKTEEVKLVGTPKAVEVSPSTLFAEVVCEFADFATSLAQKIAAKAGHHWTPQASREREKKLRKSKDPNVPRRPLSSYSLWSEHVRKKVKEQQPERGLKMSELSEMWKNLPTDHKTKWDLAAKAERDHYLKEMEAYRATQAAGEIPNGK